MRITLYAALGMLAVTLSPGATGHRKITENSQSPTAETSVMLGGHAITIEYNAPSARGRQVEGGLVPFDSVWRLGADSASWTLIVNKQTGQWGTDYDKGQDLGRVPLKVSKLGQPVETLKIALSGSGRAGALEITWGSTKAAIGIL